MKTNFVADCFNRRFSCFWDYEFSYKIFLIFVHNCPFLLLFLSLLYIVTVFKNLTEKSLTVETEHKFCFHNIWFEGLRHRSLSEIGSFFLFTFYSF